MWKGLTKFISHSPGAYERTLIQDIFFCFRMDLFKLRKHAVRVSRDGNTQIFQEFRHWKFDQSCSLFLHLNLILMLNMILLDMRI